MKKILHQKSYLILENRKLTLKSKISNDKVFDLEATYFKIWDLIFDADS